MTIEQTERLFTTRARYADNNQAIVRGTNSYIRLLTSDTQRAEYQSRSSSRAGGDSDVGDTLQSLSPSADGYGYDEFLLTGVSAQMSEKYQVTETFGDGEVVYYFGKSPMQVSLSGVLIDSVDNGWFTKWVKTYEAVFRGTMTAQNYELLEIVLPNMALIGTISDFGWSQTSDNDVAINFHMTMLVKTIRPLAPVPMDVEITNEAVKIDFAAAITHLDKAGMNAIKAQLQSMQSSSQSSLSDFGKSLTGFAKDISGFKPLAGITSMFQTIGANLNGVRVALFSPIYGVMSSLTKLVKSLNGNISSIFNSIVSPLRNILRDIRNITNMATNLVKLVTSTLGNLGRNLSNPFRPLSGDIRATLKAFKNFGGAVSTAPKTVSSIISGLYSGGVVGGEAAFLKGNYKSRLSRPAKKNKFKGLSEKDFKMTLLRSFTAQANTNGATI